MREDELMELSIDLRRKLFNDFRDFWLSHPKFPLNEVFFINSTVLSSLIAHIGHIMFKKDIGTEKIDEYINEICNFAKLQLKDAKNLMEVGIQ